MKAVCVKFKDKYLNSMLIGALLSDHFDFYFFPPFSLMFTLRFELVRSGGIYFTRFPFRDELIFFLGSAFFLSEKKKSVSARELK